MEGEDTMATLPETLDHAVEQEQLVHELLAAWQEIDDRVKVEARVHELVEWASHSDT